MPILTTIHRTTYTYDRPVTLGPHRLMLRPRETRDLRLILHELEISPHADLSWSQDVAGNTIAVATFRAETDQLMIESRSQVDLNAPDWPVFPISASAAHYPFFYTDDDWTGLGALTTPQYPDTDGRFSAWVRGFILSRPTDTLSLLQDINTGISSRILYEIRETEGTQSPLETLDRQFGSCRDLAVVLAEAARILGLGARLVSGYLFDPQTDLIGASGLGSTHAWTEIYVPGGGWITFDPTNRSMGSSNLIPAGVARDIRQVVPVSGSFGGHAAAQIAMKVEVDVRPQTP